MAQRKSMLASAIDSLPKGSHYLFFPTNMDQDFFTAKLEISKMLVINSMWNSREMRRDRAPSVLSGSTGPGLEARLFLSFAKMGA